MADQRLVALKDLRKDLREEYRHVRSDSKQLAEDYRTCRLRMAALHRQLKAVSQTINATKDQP